MQRGQINFLSLCQSFILLSVRSTSFSIEKSFLLSKKIEPRVAPMINDIKAGQCGQVVSVLALYSDNQSLISAEVYHFYVKL